MNRDYDPAFVALCQQARAQITEISLAELESWLATHPNAKIMDVRELKEFSTEGHLPGATHLSRGEIEVEIHKYLHQKSDHALLYCGSGNRSALAIVNLQKMGYTNLVSLACGYKGWLAQHGSNH